MLHREAFATQSAGPFCSRGTKEKKQKWKQDDRFSISERTPWRFFGFVIELMALLMPRESERSQILVKPRWMAWDRADRIARPSAWIADCTKVCDWHPCCGRESCVLKIQPSPTDVVVGFQDASVLQIIVPVGIDRGGASPRSLVGLVCCFSATWACVHSWALAIAFVTTLRGEVWRDSKIIWLRVVNSAQMIQKKRYLRRHP